MTNDQNNNNKNAADGQGFRKIKSDSLIKRTFSNKKEIISRKNNIQN